MKLSTNWVMCITNCGYICDFRMYDTLTRHSAKEFVSLPESLQVSNVCNQDDWSAGAVCRPPWTIAVPGSVKFTKCGSWHTTSFLAPTHPFRVGLQQSYTLLIIKERGKQWRVNVILLI